MLSRRKDAANGSRWQPPLLRRGVRSAGRRCRGGCVARRRPGPRMDGRLARVDGALGAAAGDARCAMGGLQTTHQTRDCKPPMKPGPANHP